MSIVFKPFSVSNNYNLSGIFGVITDNVSVCMRNSYVNNGTGIINLSNNSKGYTVNCNNNYDNIKEIVVLKNDDTIVGDIENIKSVTVSKSTIDPNCNGIYKSTSNPSEWTLTVGEVNGVGGVTYTALYNVNTKKWTVSRSAGKINDVSYDELANISDAKVTGNTENVYNTQSLENFGINCILSKNSCFSTDDNLHNIYQETVTDQYGSLYNFPNFDKTIPLINFLESNNSLIASYFKKEQLYSDYKSDITYNYGTIVYYLRMYFKCISNNIKNVTPGSGHSDSLKSWGAYSIAEGSVIEDWDSNKEYIKGDVVHHNYKFFRCKIGNHAQVPINELQVKSNYWEEVDLDKSVLQYKYSDFANVIITPDWNENINYRYGDVVKRDNNYYSCINDVGVTVANVRVDNLMYWITDSRFDEKFKNVYKRFDNIFVNDGNVNKFTNKAFLTKDTKFHIHNLLDIEILQNYLPRNLNGYNLTLIFHGEDLNEYINNNTIFYNGNNKNYYYISVNDRSMFDPTNEGLLKNYKDYFDKETNLLRYDGKPLVYTTDISTETSYRPVTAKINISGFYGGKIYVNIKYDKKTITGENVVKTYIKENSICKVDDKQYYVDTIPCSFTFKDIYGRIIINGNEDVSITAYKKDSEYNSSDKVIYSNTLYVCNDTGVTGPWDSTKWIEDTSITAYKENSEYNIDSKVIHEDKLYTCKNNNVTGSWDSSKWVENTSSQSRIILNTVKSDGYIFKFVNCENVEIKNIQFYMSYPNKFGGIESGGVVPNDCYQSFLVFNNCKAIVKNCWFKFVYYTYANHQYYVQNTYSVVKNNNNIIKYVFNHDFAGGLNDIQNKNYIIEGLITCENNTQCLIENDEDPSVFTNIKDFNSNDNIETNYVSILSNSQVTWLPIGIFKSTKIRETMIQYLENHLINGDPKRYKDTNLSIISGVFFNGGEESTTTGNYEESLSRNVIKASIWKRILSKYENVNGGGDESVSLSLTSQMLYVFLKLWDDESAVNVNSSGFETNNNNFFNNSGDVISTSAGISDVVKDGSWNLTKGKFKAAKILVDLLKTVEQSLNFDIVSNDDRSTSSYDTTEKTGTVVEYKKIEKQVDTTILDSLKELIGLLTLHTTDEIGNADDKLNKYFLNACEYEEHADIKPQSLINGALDTFETVLTNVCQNLGITSPTYDLSNVTQIDEQKNDKVTYSDLTINFVGAKKDLDVLGFKIVSNFNNNIFYPDKDVSFYDQVYIPEENDSIVTFSYEQMWTVGVTLLGDSRGSSTISAGGIWENNTYIEMSYEKLDTSDDISLITDETQCVIKIHFIAPSLLFRWMDFFNDIESLNWTCKTFIGVVGSLLTLFGKGRSDDGLWQLFNSGYSYAYSSATGLTNNPCYIIWYYLYNPSSETGFQKTTLQIAEQLYIIDELLSVTSSTTSGILNHFHVYPHVTSQQSGIPVGSIGITWRSYMSRDLISNSWTYPGTYDKAVIDNTVLYNKLGSQWVYCDGRKITTNSPLYEDGKIMREVYGLKDGSGSYAPKIDCINYTYYQPYIRVSISGSASACPGEGYGTSTVSASASYNGNGPSLSFSHSSTRNTASGSSCTITVNYGWNTSKCFSGKYSQYAGESTDSLEFIFNQMGYKFMCNLNGTDTKITNSPKSFSSSSDSNNTNTTPLSSFAYTVSNFRVVDSNNNVVSYYTNGNTNESQTLFRYYNGSGGYASDTQYGGEYSQVPATSTVTASCSGNMYCIVTELVYIMKISSSSSSQTNLSNLLTSSNYKSLLAVNKPTLTSTKYHYNTPHIYYDNDGVVYNISFENEYDNINNYLVSDMSEEDFKSNIWIYNILIDQNINNEFKTYTLYKFNDNKLYISSDSIKKYIQMSIVNIDQRMVALFNSKEDHKFGYNITIGKKRYNNIPVDMIINSAGMGSNDLTLLQFINKDGEYYTPNNLLEFNSIDFKQDGIFENVSMSKFNYSKLLDTNLNQFIYYQYIELDHLTENGIKTVQNIFGYDLTTIDINEFEEDKEIELYYNTGNYMTFCIYKNTKRVKCSAVSRLTNSARFICIKVSICDITDRELKTFVNSIEKQRNKKYENRSLNGALDIYQQYIKKYQLSDKDSSIDEKTFKTIINDVSKLQNDI